MNRPEKQTRRDYYNQRGKKKGATTMAIKSIRLAKCNEGAAGFVDFILSLKKNGHSDSVRIQRRISGERDSILKISPEDSKFLHENAGNEEIIREWMDENRDRFHAIGSRCRK